MGKLEDKKDFIKNIIDSTLSGNLKWTTVNSIFNTYKRQKYKLSLNNNLYLTCEINLDYSNSIFLYDMDTMLDHYNTHDLPDLKNLLNFLKKDFLENQKRDIPESEKDDFYKNLSKNFTKKSFRKKKLDEIILDEDEDTDILDENKNKINILNEDRDENIWTLCIPIIGFFYYFLMKIDTKYKPVIFAYFLLQFFIAYFLFINNLK